MFTQIIISCLTRVSPNTHLFAKVCLNGKKFGNQMAFGYQTFHHGCKSNDLDHSIRYHLKTEQLQFVIQISLLFKCLLFRSALYLTNISVQNLKNKFLILYRCRCLLSVAAPCQKHIFYSQ